MKSKKLYKFLLTQEKEMVERIEEYFGHIVNDGVTGKPMRISLHEIANDIRSLLTKDNK
jgi:hypothetical protein